MAGSPPIADRRSWMALLVSTAIAIGLCVRWHRLGWVFGGIAVLLAARSLSMVLAAKAAMSDPEDALEKEQQGKPD